MKAQPLKISKDVCSSQDPLKFQLEDLGSMAPPIRRQKLVVSDHGGFNIHVNAQQSRYQVYQNQVELKSFSWGAQHQRLKQSWRQVQDLIAKTEATSTTS